MNRLFDGSVLVTSVVLVGFAVISFLAMKPEATGVRESVVLYLLGAWQSMAAAAVAYWIGSSSGSRDKDATIKSMSNDAATTATATAATAATAASAAAAAIDAAKAVTATATPETRP